MKKSTFKRIASVLFTVVLLAAAAALPISAETTAAVDYPTINVNPNYSPNAIIRTIANTIVTLIAIAGVVYGGWTLAQGLIGHDPKEKRDGILTLFGALILGGLILTVLNLILL